MPTKRKTRGDEAANSAPAVAVKEHRESLAETEKKAETLAGLIKVSKHFIVFTGAGISTSAGIPDFRGPDGNWTLRAQGRPRTTHADTLSAVPTKAHMALVELQNRGILKYLVSQNCDGLHRRSGIEAQNISELHGNNTREVCKSCGKEYIRDYRVSGSRPDHNDHRTGRRCLCGGILLDTIINFGEGLPEKDLRLARDNTNKADLCLVLGSSVSVTPACTIPETVASSENAKLAICNLQPTALDDDCDLRIFAEADILMTKVMEHLKYAIPPFELRRNLLVKIESLVEDMHNVAFKGLDADGTTPISFIKAAGVEGCRRFARAEPFSLNLRRHLQPGHAELKFTIELFGHYDEPYLEIAHDYVGDEIVMYSLRYEPLVGEWDAKQEQVDSGLGKLFDR
ncbi:DHS-like NAD/FAD-binding domain-containing protein [Aspergillus germanicus]